LAFSGVISREVEDDSLIQKPSLAALNANSRFDMQPELSKHPLFQSSRGVRNSVKTGTAAIGIIGGSIIPHAPSIAPERPALEKVVCHRRHPLPSLQKETGGHATLEKAALASRPGNSPENSFNKPPITSTSPVANKNN